MIPSSKYPQRKLPAPFQRPSISVGGSQKRQWGWVLPESIEPGDLIPDFGIIGAVVVASTGDVLIVGRGKEDFFDRQKKIWAFTHL